MQAPICPLLSPAHRCCVTPHCPANPFLCTIGSCPCQPAHTNCLTMLCPSLLQLLHQCPLPPWADYLLLQMDKIYTKIISRAKDEMGRCRERVREAVYGREYTRVRDLVQKGQYEAVGAGSLGVLVARMKAGHGARGTAGFTVGDMRGVEAAAEGLFKHVEGLSMAKYQQLEASAREHRDRSDSQSTLLKTSTHKHSSSDLTPPLTKSLLLTSSPKPSAIASLSLNPESGQYPKSINSLIISTASILNSFLCTKVQQYKLLYRASENNFELKNFYDRLSKVYSQRDDAVVLLLVKTEHGKVVGGWTGLKWQQPQKVSKLEEDDDSGSDTGKILNSKYKQDIRGSSCVFSVDLGQKYPLLQPAYAIYCGNCSIGFGRRDLRLVNHSQKHRKNYLGFPNSYNNGLYLAQKKSSLSLSGGHSGIHFRVPEWEAHEVVFHKNKHARELARSASVSKK